jgi:hypothetical protein
MVEKMIVRLNDRLQVNEEQKTEITSMLFTFIKNMNNDYGKNVSTPEIVSAWLKYTHKPEWMQKKLNEDVDFLAGICEFIERYKGEVNKEEIEHYNIQYKM